MGDPGNSNGAAPLRSEKSGWSLGTIGIHGDDQIKNEQDVAPSLHVSTTYRYSRDPDKLCPEWKLPNRDPTQPPAEGHYVYSRYMAPNSSRLELMLTKVLDAPCLTYASGLSAFHALLVHLHPKVVAIGAGYHGCHGVLKIYQRLTNCKIVDLFDEKSWDNQGEGWSLSKGDVVHLETPVNPTGLAYDIKKFADMTHKRGAVLTVDATFGPPPLQDPLKLGADYVFHSGTKYFGGHSDMLCGVIAIGTDKKEWADDYWGLLNDRNVMGSVLGNMEGWLGVRSLRTLHLRVERQSQNCDRLVAFLDSCLQGTAKSDGAAAVKRVVAKLEHASLQHSDMDWLRKQMPNGFGPVFSISTHTEEQAKRLPSKLQLFHHATSLGGVESLIEWRHMSDKTVEKTLCRISIGAESWEDLRDDLVQGCQALVAEGRGGAEWLSGVSVISAK